MLFDILTQSEIINNATSRSHVPFSCRRRI